MTDREICLKISDYITSQMNYDDFNCQIFPDDIKLFQMKHPNGSILVKTGKSNLAEPQGFIQTEFIEVVITILAKKLNGDSGLYVCEELIRQNVATLSFSGAKCYLTTKSEPIFYLDVELWVRELTFILPQLIYNGQ